MRRGGAGAVIVAMGLAGACTYDFDQFAGQGGSRGGAGHAGSGGGTSNAGGGKSGASGAGGGTAGVAGSAGAAGSGGAVDGGGRGGSAGNAGAAGSAMGGGGAGVDAGRGGVAGSGGMPVADASDSATSDVPADSRDAGIDAGFDCSSVSGIVYMGHCYFGRTGPFTWDVAATSCPNGAHLVTITSAGEQVIAQQILANQDRWIGMREPATAPNMEQFYYWVTGETFTPGTSYTNWDVYSDADREPNFTGDCVRMEFNSKWADDGCTKAYSAICERE